MPVLDVVYALDFSFWKKSSVRQCFPQSRVIFIDRVAGVPAGAQLVLWGLRAVPDGLPPDIQIVRIEDGFIRSVGLGADLIRPLSWVVDRQGMYYDATRPSDLETLLSQTSFDIALLQRAAQLRRRIVAEGITKYNVGSQRWQRPASAAKVILVPGQVESDASLAFGAPQIRTNLGLLQAVRQANPKAYLIYKPHPDVLAGLRADGVDAAAIQQFCDVIVTEAAMGDLLMAVDEVHVLTSLAGFEALLRGKSVTCYGQPFYAGWGLTIDMVPPLRRGRQLTIDELVAGALICYPIYFSRTGSRVGKTTAVMTPDMTRAMTPEQALDELLAWRAQAGTTLPWWRRVFRMILRRVVGVR